MFGGSTKRKSLIKTKAPHRRSAGFLLAGRCLAWHKHIQKMTVEGHCINLLVELHHCQNLCRNVTTKLETADATIPCSLGLDPPEQEIIASFASRGIWSLSSLAIVGWKYRITRRWPCLNFGRRENGFLEKYGPGWFRWKHCSGLTSTAAISLLRACAAKAS